MLQVPDENIDCNEEIQQGENLKSSNNGRVNWSRLTAKRSNCSPAPRRPHRAARQGHNFDSAASWPALAGLAARIIALAQYAQRNHAVST